MNPSPTIKPLNSIKLGDLIQLGDHRIICGDARDPEVVKRLVGNLGVNLVLTDVPYGIDLTASKLSFGQNISVPKDILNDHFQTDEEYSVFTQSWINAVKPYLAEKNSLYIFNCDKMIFALRDGMLKAGCRFSQLIIWVKNSAVMSRLDYRAQHELIAVGWYGTHKFYRGSDQSVMACPKPNKSPYHATQKPVSLLRRLILNSSKIDDVVYDCFLGSGSTLLAAEQTHRTCLGVELDPDYCLTTVRRWEKLTHQQAQLIQ